MGKVTILIPFPDADGAWAAVWSNVLVRCSEWNGCTLCAIGPLVGCTLCSLNLFPDHKLTKEAKRGERERNFGASEDG